MKIILSIFFIVFTCFFSKAQMRKIVDSTTVIQEKDSVIQWKKKNKIGLDISEVAFVNWSAGGGNSISGLLKFELIRNFKNSNSVWDNKLVARYGINKQKSENLRKTEDVLELYSTFGYKNDILSNWYSSIKFSFKTQFNKGYNYKKSEDNHISKFMAPAYFFLGVGTIYELKRKKLKAYISPLTLKSTFVLDQDLANIGAFGVKKAIYSKDGMILEEGNKTRNELGVLLTCAFESKIMKNILFRNIMSLYSDYINNIGNIDIDLEMVFDFKINNYIRATFVSHLKYDDDIKIAANEKRAIKASGAKVQWKQLLGIGVVYNF